MFPSAECSPSSPATNRCSAPKSWAVRCPGVPILGSCGTTRWKEQIRVFKSDHGILNLRSDWRSGVAHLCRRLRSKSTLLWGLIFPFTAYGWQKRRRVIVSLLKRCHVIMACFCPSPRTSTADHAASARLQRLWTNPGNKERKCLNLTHAHSQFATLTFG